MDDIITPCQEQIHDLLFSREIGWKDIIYDLINTEQLDPWDVDITILSEKYLQKVSEYEEADFFISSKVLLAASLLLRIKSEILLNTYIKSIDEILFGKSEKKQKIIEKLDLTEEIPDLMLKSPVPRYKRVTLKELLFSLSKAINTENRRIKKEIVNNNALRETGISMPKRKFSIKNKIREIHDKLSSHFNENKNSLRISLTDLAKGDRSEKIICFFPLLHLENSKKLWLEQENHFEEIYIWMKKTYLHHRGDPFADLREKINELENTEEFPEDKIESYE